MSFKCFTLTALFRATTFFIGACCIVALPAFSTYAADSKDIVARIKSSPPVGYPVDARRNNVEGTVMLELELDAEGKLKGSRVINSSGSGLLDSAALEWVELVTFTPAQHEGQPVSSTKQLKVDFNLNDIEEELQQASEGTDPAVVTKQWMDYNVKKLQLNSANAYCGQKAYLQCYSLDYTRCIDELSTIKEDCFSRAKEKFAHTDTQEDFLTFMTFYTACMQVKHVNMHLSNVVEINSCLSNFNLNKDKFEADILR